jgi:O-antigen/teichoic acid export membrane protein
MLPLRKKLLFNSSWMTLGLGIRTVFQAVYFILIARAIGPAEYGILSSIMALIGILAPFASWGSGNILVKHTSRDAQLFSKYWGAAIATTIASSLFFIIISLFLAKIVLPDNFDFWLVLSIGLAELFFTRLMNISAQAFQAVERLSVTAQIYILFSAMRLFCAIIFINSNIELSANNWAFFYLISTIVSALPALFWVYRSLGWGKISILPIIPELKEGFYFSLGSSSQGFYNDIDKTLLARISGNEVAGIYTVAYRIIDAAFVPISALLNSTYARFFKLGEAGVAKTKQYAIKLLPVGIAYTLFASLIIYLFAPVIPSILGKNYSETSKVILWLTPLLSLKVTHYFASDALSGAGYQSYRSGIQIFVAFINLVLNLIWIPIFGWLGAVWSSLCSDGILMFSFWVTILILQNREKTVRII